MTRLKHITRLLFTALFSLTYVVASAQTDREHLSVDSMVEKLAPAPRTRGITRNIVPTPAKIDLTIHFDFDSNRLQDRSRPLLDNLAAAMKNDRLSELKFRVEGHTDAKGTASYNENLSRRRADAVVSYLAQQGINATRLHPEGKGFRELFDAAEPLSALNRRVSVVTIE
jgi:outer membrane protein OmpA-like peptidoglycan-associated protein